MKAILTVIFLSLFTINNNCQIISGYGVKLGAGISNQFWDYEIVGSYMDYDSKMAVSPRLFADFFNISFLQLEGEIGYLRKGFTEKLPVTTMIQPYGTGEFITTDVSLDYLSISALAKLKYEAGMISPYLILGPQLDILFNKSTLGWDVIFDKFSNANICMSIGGGVELNNILSIPLILEYRYERDLMDNYDSPNIDILNYSHVILLGIRL